jgi:hypothetical protein
MSVRLQQVAPIFPVRSVRAALEHYRKLGFTTDAYDEQNGGDPIVNVHLT